MATMTTNHEDEKDARTDEGHEASAQAPGKDVEDFFQRLPGSFRWPKPNAEAVAAAVEAIHRMSGGTETILPTTTIGPTSIPTIGPATAEGDELGSACSGCGGSLPAGARFCVWCGLPTQSVAGDAAPSLARAGSGQHHIHHHYHHLVQGQGVLGQVVQGLGASQGVSADESVASVPRGRAPGPSGNASSGTGSKSGGRAEVAARQVVQDWAHACNTRHIDDLLELYASDATLIRSSVPPVRSLQAIREFLISLLEAGLGDVEMESLRVELMGDIAIDLGRCKMLVPVAMGKRREERGKYLVVLVRQPAGTWKILADCWSADLAVSAPAEPAARKASETIPPARRPR